MLGRKTRLSSKKTQGMNEWAAGAVYQGKETMTMTTYLNKLEREVLLSFDGCFASALNASHIERKLSDLALKEGWLEFGDATLDGNTSCQVWLTAKGRKAAGW